MQEHNNLKTKVLFGGSYSNYTKRHVIDESSLIDVYHQCHVNIERNLLLAGLTSHHTPPDLTNTYRALLDYMSASKPNDHTAGRTAAYNIPDMITKGLSVLLTTEAKDVRDELDEMTVEEEDILVDLEL